LNWCPAQKILTSRICSESEEARRAKPLTAEEEEEEEEFFKYKAANKGLRNHKQKWSWH
jgi:hypothetical protein